MTFTDSGYDVAGQLNACGPRTYTIVGDSWTSIARTTGDGDSNTDTYTITASPIISTLVDVHTFQLKMDADLYPAIATLSV